LQAVLPVDEPSLSEANIDSSSESSSSLPPVHQVLTGGRKTTETKPSQCSERSDSDSCVLVGYVKPLHDRTPEIISLSSSDSEDDVKVSMSFYVVDSCQMCICQSKQQCGTVFLTPLYFMT
jgi:hypothetical protein